MQLQHFHPSCRVVFNSTLHYCILGTLAISFPITPQAIAFLVTQLKNYWIASEHFVASSLLILHTTLKSVTPSSCKRAFDWLLFSLLVFSFFLEVWYLEKVWLPLLSFMHIYVIQILHSSYSLLHFTKWMYNKVYFIYKLSIWNLQFFCSICSIIGLIW